MTHVPFRGIPQSDYRLFHPEKERGTVILGLRTDKPEAELYLYDGQKKLGEKKWQAHRELAETIHKQINKLLMLQGLSLQQIEGIVCFKGPGSFTGLRISLSVANALAYAQAIPIVAKHGEKWIESGIKDLLAGKKDRIALPYYDRPAATTPPRK
ncbi:tRNA (adenosine(37)-N6)-threonylcarbamoyltransferase complex dimerization subunit type 1 TsaB [Candidatus Saccharibacteria bacterium]|nr:tRNA (adenosine(37)-N6)-threonylcarbamoyltransferase complex dimerization subunit type 1 TsaB [Candidatus Saccharibacteria bacterium]